ncbi:MAG: hypothetical protein V7K47_21900 [Nostoc sp.]
MISTLISMPHLLKRSHSWRAVTPSRSLWGALHRSYPKGSAKNQPNVATTRSNPQAL